MPRLRRFLTLFVMLITAMSFTSGVLLMPKSSYAALSGDLVDCVCDPWEICDCESGVGDCGPGAIWNGSYCELCWNSEGVALWAGDNNCNIRTCFSGYTLVNNQCVAAGKSCAAGYYWNGSACATCTAGYYCPGFSNVSNPAANYGRTACTGTNYSYAGQSSCTPCPNNADGYYDYTGGGNNTVYKCYKRVPWTSASPNGTGTSNCYYTSGSGTSAIYAGNGANGAGQCDAHIVTSCNAGYYYVGGNACSPVTPGYYSPAGSTDRTQCAAGTYSNSTTAAACTPCAVGSYSSAAGRASCLVCQGGATTSGTGQTSCNATCSNKNSYVSAWATASWSANSVTNLCKISGCSAGYWSSNNAACSTVGGGYWSAAGTITRTACPTGYVNGSTIAASQAECAIVCSTGTRVATAGAQCTSPAGPWIGISNIPILYGHLSPIIHCMAGYNSTGTTATAHDNPSDCTMAVSGGMHVPSNLISARYVRLSSNGNSSNRQTYVVEIHAYSLNLGGTNYLEGVPATSYSSAPGGATDGNFDRTSHTNCGTGTPCVWDMGAVREIGSIVFAMYSDGRIYENVTVQVSTDNSNWTTVFGPMNIQTTNQLTARTEFLWLSSGAKSCAAGSALAAHTEVLGTPTTCTSCVAGTYAGPGNSSCSACATGSYSASAGAGVCTPCQNGTTTSAAGQTSCNATCSNKNAYASSWTTATWSGNTVANSCKISGCTAGYGSTSNAACAICTVGTASAAGALACSKCTGATYQDQTGQASCKSCPANTYDTGLFVSIAYNNSTGTQDSVTRCRAQWNGKTDAKGVYNYSCNYDPVTQGYGSHTGTTGNDCMADVQSCAAGYFIKNYNSGISPGWINGVAATNRVWIANRNAVLNICGTVDAGYWSAAGALTRTACATGLTTIGYGAGADEAADCGRILNYGSNKLYLRSVKKTTPSLVLSISGAKYYGNMSTATKGKLRINSGGTKYSVYDDSM